MAEKQDKSDHDDHVNRGADQIRRLVVVSDEMQGGGGSPRTQLDIAYAFAATGVEVDLVYLRDGRFLESWRSLVGRLIRVPFRRPSSAEGRFIKGVSLWMWNVSGALYAAVRLGRPLQGEIVYTHGHRGDLFPAAVIAMARRRPLVMLLCVPASWHGDIDSYPFWRRWAIGRVTRFVAVAEHVADQWSAAGLRREQIDVVHSGIDAEHWKPADEVAAEDVRRSLGISPSDYVVLYAGRFDTEKGLFVLRARSPRLAMLARHISSWWASARPIANRILASQIVSKRSLPKAACTLSHLKQISGLGTLPPMLLSFRVSLKSHLPGWCWRRWPASGQ